MHSTHRLLWHRSPSFHRGVAVAAALALAPSAAFARPSVDVNNAEAALVAIEKCLAEGDQCRGPLSQLEMAVRGIERDEPKVDVSRYKAALARKAEIQAAAAALNRLGDYPDALKRFMGSANLNECITSPSGCSGVLTELKELNPLGTRALLSKPAVTPALQERLDRVKKGLSDLAPEIAKFGDKVAAVSAELFGSAKTFRKDSMIAASDLVDRSLETLTIAMQIEPAHPGCVKQKATSAAMRAELDKEFEKAYTSPWHKQNVSTVLLASEMPEAHKENPSMFKTSFKAGEPIYGIAYFRSATGELSGDIGQTVAVHVLLKNGDKALDSAGYFIAPDAEAYKATWTAFEVMPKDASKVKELNVAADLSKALAGLDKGKHTISVVVSVMNGDGSKGQEVAKTSFTYDASGGQEAAQAIATKLADRVLDEARMPEAAMKDPKLEKLMQAAAAKNDFGDVPLRVVIIDDAFTYEKAPVTGIILSRSIHTAVATKGKDGTCMVRQIRMKQVAVGKKFDPPTAAMPSDESPIRCENANK